MSVHVLWFFFDIIFSIPSFLVILCIPVFLFSFSALHTFLYKVVTLKFEGRHLCVRVFTLHL